MCHDGKLSSWIFSSNENNARDGPTSVCHAHSTAVVSIVTLPDARNNEPYFEQELAKLMLSASCDGSACLFGISKSGFLVPLHLYFSPGPTRAIVVCQGALTKTPDAEVEILQINETSMTSFIALTAPYNSSAIPVRWRHDAKPKLVDDLYVPVPVSHLLRRNSGTSTNSESSISRIASSSSAEVMKAADNSLPRELSLDFYVGNNGQSSPNDDSSHTRSHLNSPLSRSSSALDTVNDSVKSVASHLSLHDLKQTSSARQQWMKGGDNESVDSEMKDDCVGEEEKASVDNWTDTLGIRTELFLAKKNGELIETPAPRPIRNLPSATLLALLQLRS